MARLDLVLTAAWFVFWTAFMFWWGFAWEKTRTRQLFEALQNDKTRDSGIIDCLDILPEIRAGSVDAVITDPPFFMPVDHYASTVYRGRKWSDSSILGGWWRQVVKELHRTMKPSGHLLVFCDAPSHAVFFPALYETFRSVDGLIWVKRDGGGIGTPWQRQHELVLSACDAGAAYKPPSGTCGGNVFRINPTDAKRREHPVEKPRELLAELIRRTTPEGGLVLDAFAGSGTTLEAAEQMGRDSIGIEASPDYCDLIRRRMATIQPTML